MGVRCELSLVYISCLQSQQGRRLRTFAWPLKGFISLIIKISFHQNSFIFQFLLSFFLSLQRSRSIDVTNFYPANRSVAFMGCAKQRRVKCWRETYVLCFMRFDVFVTTSWYSINIFKVARKRIFGLLLSVCSDVFAFVNLSWEIKDSTCCAIGT